MIDQKFLTIFSKLYDLLSNTNINWVVTGSLGFSFQGLETKVNDIDIQTDKNGAYEIERLFSDYVVRKVALSTSSRIKSHFGALRIDGIDIEIMGNIQKRLNDGTWEDPVNLSLYKKFVESNGMKIPVLSLEYEYSAYLKLGRIKKAEMLKSWLDENYMKNEIL